MNYLYKSGFAALLILPTAAQAHPGTHASIEGIMAALAHLLSQPDHALLLAGAALAGACIAGKAVARMWR